MAKTKEQLNMSGDNMRGMVSVLASAAIVAFVTGYLTEREVKCYGLNPSF